MPTATANGKRFTFPEGTTPEQMGQAIDEYFTSNPIAETTEQPEITQPAISTLPQASNRFAPQQPIVTGGQQMAMLDQEREAFLQSLTPERRAQLESIGGFEALGIGLGKGFSDVARGVGLMPQASEDEKRYFKELERVQPVAAGGGEVAGQAAPFIAPGMGVASIASTPLRVAATAGLGATEGGVIARGQGGDIGQQLLSAGIGGTVAGALELGVPVIGRIGGKIYRKLTGKTPTGAVVDKAGNLSQEMMAALQKEGLDPQDLLDDALVELKGQVVNPEQAARKAFLESQGLTGEAAPTRAQITRSVDDFSMQQEAMKSSGRLERRIVAQDQVLTTRFNDAIMKTDGDPFSSSSVADSVLTKASVLDKQIGQLYKQARERAPAEKIVRFESLSKKLKELAPLNERSRGNVKAIVDTLKEKGLIDKSFKPSGRLDVEATETQVRQLINDLYDDAVSGGDIQNSVLRQMKEALDEDVFRSTGDDLFKQAQKAKYDFEKELNRAKVSKFDKRKSNLVRDILENKNNVAPDRFVDNVVYGKQWRDTDLQELKDYIGTEDYGKASWNDLRAEVLQKIKEKSFIGPEDAQGFRSLSRDKIQSALSGIGDNKLKVLFNEEELHFLKNLEKVARFREPRKFTGQGYGPSAKAILSLEKKISNLPVIGQVFGFLEMDAAGRLATRSAPARLSAPTTGSTARQALSLGGAAVATQQAGEQ